MVRNTDFRDDEASANPESATQNQSAISSNDYTETLETLDIGHEGQYTLV